MATREETKAMIAVMQAYVDGAEIEGRSDGCFTNWISVTPGWNWVDCLYRRVREPKWRPATMDDVGKEARFSGNQAAWEPGILMGKFLVNGQLEFVRRTNPDALYSTYQFCEVQE